MSLSDIRNFLRIERPQMVTAAESQAIATAKSVLDASNTDALKKLHNFLRISKDNFRLALGEAYASHIASTYRRFANLRTLWTRDREVPLLSIYVPLQLASDGQTFLEEELFQEMPRDAKVLIQGTGGAGKSMIMRYLVIKMMAKPSGRIPIFAELRALNFDNNDTFEDILFRHINKLGNEETHYLFLKTLSEGLGQVFLDGLDEVPTAQRDQALRKLDSFAARHPRLSIIISSRPGNSRDSLPDFEIFNIQPLNLEQVIEVVNKTTISTDTKDAFILKLDEGLFDEHRTFLGIPLLVVMMLLTFNSYAEIPDRMSVFYEQAFSTLYAIHDTVSKGPYKRQHYASLAPDEFTRVFENFCYLTLSKEKYEFLYHEIYGFLERSIDYSQIDADPEKYLQDLEESVCLILRDGVKYSFTHRSFQEHFASRFALRYSGRDGFTIVDRIIGREFQHFTVKLLSEIDAIKFRDIWIVPALKELVSIVKAQSRLPLNQRFRMFVGGWHVGFSGNTPTEKWGCLSLAWVIDPTFGNDRFRNLSVALARVTSLPSPYEAFNLLNKLPRSEQEFAKLIEDADKDHLDLRLLYEGLYKVGLGDDHSSHHLMAFNGDLMIRDNSDDWLSSVGADTVFREYLASAEMALAAELKLVEEHRGRESTLF